MKEFAVGVILLLICICSAGCITYPPGEQPNSTPEIRLQFSYGDIITKDPSNGCIGQFIAGYHQPTDSYILKGVRCISRDNFSWEWSGVISRVPVSTIDGDSYVKIGHIDETNIVGPYRTIT